MMKHLSIGQLAWHEVTRNHYVADLAGHGHTTTIEVVRHQQWKLLAAQFGDPRQWRVVVFGQRLNRRGFERLGDAQYVAGRTALDFVGEVAQKMGMRFPPMSEMIASERKRRARKRAPKGGA
jgi:hypothetical protein